MYILTTFSKSIAFHVYRIPKRGKFKGDHVYNIPQMPPIDFPKEKQPENQEARNVWPMYTVVTHTAPSIQWKTAVLIRLGEWGRGELWYILLWHFVTLRKIRDALVCPLSALRKVETEVETHKLTMNRGFKGEFIGKYKASFPGNRIYCSEQCSFWQKVMFGGWKQIP